MRLIGVLMIAGVCMYPIAWGQFLTKSARRIADANPDIIEFSFTIAMAIDVPGTNLTETTNPFLSVGNYSTNGTITSAGGVVTVTFNTTLQSDSVILSYNVTLQDGGENFSGLVNLTSTITYYTTSFMNATNSSSTTVCIGKRERLLTSYTEENWYIAITVFLGLILGAILTFALANVLMRGVCQSGGSTIPGAGKWKDEESTVIGSTASSNLADLSHVLQCEDTLKSGQLLELCELNELINVECRLQNERADALWTLLPKESNDRRTESTDIRLVKEEIQQKIKNIDVATQDSLAKEREKNDSRKSALLRKHDAEKEKLRKQSSLFEPETQTEFERLLENQQSLESIHEEHIAGLRLKEIELRGGHPTEITCDVLENKLKTALEKPDRNSPSNKGEAYALYSQGIARIFRVEQRNFQMLRTWRIQEIAKIRNYEKSIRTSWNRFGKIILDCVKTICRELLLEAEFRKLVVSFVKEEMVKMKQHFDQEMTKMRSEFLQTCQLEKHKYFTKNQNYRQRKLVGNDSASKWVEDSLSKAEKDIWSLMNDQSKYDVFVMELWNSKFQTVLLSTSDKMKAMKTNVIDQLAQQGASRNTVGDFIETESKESSVGKPDRVTPCQFTDEEVQNHGESQTKDLTLHCYQQCLKTFGETQPFLVDKSKLKMDIEPAQHRHPKSMNYSLHRIRELIQHHTRDLEIRTSTPKHKKNKRSAIRPSEEELRSELESSLEKWREENSEVIMIAEHDVDNYHRAKELVICEETLRTIISGEISDQWRKKSTLDLLQLDLNALERLMIVLLQLLVSERKISPSECNTVIQQHRIQTEEIRSASSTRTRRRLEQVTRRRMNSPRPIPPSKDSDSRVAATSQIMYHLDTHKSVARNGINTIIRDTEAAKERFEVLTQLNEQQASELRELRLKVIHALTKVAKVPSEEISACFALLLHHRKQEDIEKMMRLVFMGENDQGKINTGVLRNIREMMAQQKHRLAENILRTDDDFTPTPLVHSSNRLQRIKQPHHVTFEDGSPNNIGRNQLSPLPGIRPEPVGRTSTPDQSFAEFTKEDRGNLYSKPVKPPRRRKKKSLKSLSVAR